MAENNNNLKVRFNKGNYVEILKEKLVEKYFYFQGTTNPCYKDHKSEFVEIEFKTTFSVFKQVMEFIKTGSIKFENENENVFGVYYLADYLLMDDLKETCLDYFTYNLNHNSVRLDLDILKTYDKKEINMNENVSSALDLFKKYNPDKINILENFVKRALTFKETGRPRFSGMYVVISYGYKTWISMYSRERLRDCLFFKVLNIEREFFVRKVELENFGKTTILCITQQTTNLLGKRSHNNQKKLISVENKLIQCDIRTGMINEMKLEHSNQAIICSNQNYLFAISAVENENINELFSLSIFNDTEKMKLSKSIFLNPLSHLNRENKVKVQLYFSHSTHDTLHVFYDTRNTKKTLENIYMMTICTQTLSVVKNEKLTNQILKVDSNIKTKNISFNIFSKMFFLKQESKLFIKVNEDLSKVLVFDVANKSFYFDKSIEKLVKPAASYHSNSYATTSYQFTMKGNVLYSVCYYKYYYSIFYEFKSLNYEKNNFTVKTKFIKERIDGTSSSKVNIGNVLGVFNI